MLILHFILHRYNQIMDRYTAQGNAMMHMALLVLGLILNISVII